jgi:hypothetical protein
VKIGVKITFPGQRSGEPVRVLRANAAQPKGVFPMRRRKHANVLSPGDLRLLRDLVAVHVLTESRRSPARERLEQKLGRDFARTLIASLAETPAKAA